MILDAASRSRTIRTIADYDITFDFTELNVSHLSTIHAGLHLRNRYFLT